MDIKTRLEQSTYRKSDARIVDLRKRVLEDGPIVEGRGPSEATRRMERILGAKFVRYG